jgi:hypothetical protein
MIAQTVVEGTPRELHPLVLEEVFAIGREALINALSHSAGQHVEVEITYMMHDSFVCEFAMTDEELTPPFLKTEGVITTGVCAACENVPARLALSSRYVAGLAVVPRLN